MKVSVIIPVLNEYECLPAILASLKKQDWIHEVIVVDGGSIDGTRQWLERQSTARVLDSPPGKGRQLNAGARVSTGDLLLFLHGDCLLPPGAGARLRQALADQTVVGGCFSVSFAEKHPWSLRLVAWGINLRTRVTRTATGDQAIFVQREVFKSFGGCADWPLFEDVDLVRRIKRRGEFRVLSSQLTISARRYVCYGVFKTVLLMFALRLGFWVGVSPFTLKSWFDDVRPHLGLRGNAVCADARRETFSS